jgi:hypothetical protein
MNGAILYPTDEDIMTLCIIEHTKSIRELIDGLPQPLTELMAKMLGATYKYMIYAVINAYTTVYEYKPLKINETVLG